MDDLEIKIREAMKTEGIDLIGFASRACFDCVDAQHYPFSIFPEGKTVIMLGKRICRGALRGVVSDNLRGYHTRFSCLRKDSIQGES